MVPLVGDAPRTADFVKARRRCQAQGRHREPASTWTYLVGTMIELPRAALRAHDIAQSAEFFSFGTNDLTQTTLRHFARRRRPLPESL
jgi:pyruvate,orthophosphate dikinase